MSSELQLIKDKLPSFADMHSDPDMAVRMDLFKMRLNSDPPAKWVLKNKFANNSDYLPIDKVEQLLDSIFQDWKIEVLREGTMFQSVTCTVRVHYLHPIKQEWRYHDGVGAHNVQIDSGEDFSINSIKDAAIKMALPIAKSEAIKDACDHLGKVFGRDLNRKHSIDFSPAYAGKLPVHKTVYPDKSTARLIDMIKSSSSRTDLEKLKKHVSTSEESTAFDEMWKQVE